MMLFHPEQDHVPLLLVGRKLAYSGGPRKIQKVGCRQMTLTLSTFGHLRILFQPEQDHVLLLLAGRKLAYSGGQRKNKKARWQQMNKTMQL